MVNLPDGIVSITAGCQCEDLAPVVIDVGGLPYIDVGVRFKTVGGIISSDPVGLRILCPKESGVVLVTNDATLDVVIGATVNRTIVVVPFVCEEVSSFAGEFGEAVNLTMDVV